MIIPTIGIIANNQLDTLKVDSIEVIQKDTVNETIKITDNISSIKRDLMEAIIYVESGGNVNARNGSCCGPMQISPGMVKECNNILKTKGSKKRFTLADRFNLSKSKEMFLLFNDKYNPRFNIEKAIRSWNGGLGYKIRSTQRYYNKVIARYNKIHKR